MALADVYELALGMTIGTEKMVNVLHFIQQEADGPGSMVAALHEAFVEDVIDVYKQCCSQDLTFQTTRIRKVFPAVGGTFTTTIGVTGTIAQPTLPPNAACLVSLYGIDGYQKDDRGRIWMPGVPVTVHNEGRITEGYRNLCNNFADSLLTTIEGTTAGIDFRCGLFGRTSHIFQNLATYRVQVRLRNLRSRTVRV